MRASTVVGNVSVIASHTTCAASSSDGAAATLGRSESTKLAHVASAWSQLVKLVFYHFRASLRCESIDKLEAAQRRRA